MTTAPSVPDWTGAPSQRLGWADEQPIAGPEAGEVGRTILTDHVTANSDPVRVLLRQVMRFELSTSVRIEFLRAPGSSAETWWEHARRAARRRLIVRNEGYSDRAHGDFDIEIIDGADVMVREAVRADEEILIVDYALTRPDAEADTKIRLAWPGLRVSDITFTIQDHRAPTDR